MLNKSLKNWTTKKTKTMKNHNEESEDEETRFYIWVTLGD